MPIYEGLYDSIKDTKNKASALMKERLLEELEAAADKDLNLKAAAKVEGYNKPAHMKGMVMLGILTLSRNRKPHVDAELLARNILTMEEFVAECGELTEQQFVDDVLFSRKKHFLKLHEANRVARLENRSIDLKTAFKETTAIKPMSDMVKQLLLIDTTDED